MDPHLAHRLIDLNRVFYQSFASQFSATRRRVQPGVRQALEAWPPRQAALDLGCGNGELRRELARRGYTGRYVGVDFSPELLAEAAEASEAAGSAGTAPEADGSARAGEESYAQPAEVAPAPTFIAADLAASGWEASLLARPGLPSRFDWIAAFAVLHHLPGRELRLQLLRLARRLLAPGGVFIHSEWQFLNSPRLAAHLQPWEAAGIDPAGLDPGDALLDWRSGGHGLRYVHHFTLAELEDLAATAGFQVRSTFFSDGDRGNLGLYQVWE